MTQEIGVHTAVAGSGDWDEIWLWGTNDWTSAVSVIVYFGETTAPITATIPSRTSPYSIIPGWILNNGRGVSAVCYRTASIDPSPQLTGYVNRIEA